MRLAGPGRADRRALAALVAASLPLNLDPTIHNIAVVAAGNALRMTSDQRSLAASIGTLCIAASILATGSLGDRLGRRRIMIAGLLVTLAGGLVTALAPDAALFSTGRCLSGVGFAASFGLSFALLRTIAPQPGALARRVAQWLALQTLGIVALSLVGGYLAGVNWRAAYLVGPAVAIAALPLCRRWVPETRDQAPGAFDGLGLSLVAGGLVASLYAVSKAASAGWGSPGVLLPLGGGLALLAGFCAWEWRSRQPAFPIRTFADRELLVGAISGMGFNIANAVVAIQLSLLWQNVYRFSPFAVSLGLLPFIAASIVAASWAGQLLARGVPMRLLVCGGQLAMGASVAVMAFAEGATPYPFFVLPLLVAGAGLMFTQTPSANAFVAKPPPALVGAIGSSRTAFGQFGFALGLALSSSLFYGLLPSLLRERLQAAGIPPGAQAQAMPILEAHIQGRATGTFAPDLVQAVITSGSLAHLSSYRITMLAMAALIAALAALCLWLLPKEPAPR